MEEEEEEEDEEEDVGVVYRPRWADVNRIEVKNRNHEHGGWSEWMESHRSIRVMLIEHAERPGVLWFARKSNRPSRSLWRHYPVRLESIFSTCCGNDCAAGRCVPGLFAGRQDDDATLPLRHLSLIRLTTDSRKPTVPLHLGSYLPQNLPRKIQQYLR